MVISAVLQLAFPGFLCISFFLGFSAFLHLMNRLTIIWERAVNSNMDHTEQNPTMEDVTCQMKLGLHSDPWPGAGGSSSLCPCLLTYIFHLQHLTAVFRPMAAYIFSKTSRGTV